jgi:hypothetical protein
MTTQGEFDRRVSQLRHDVDDVYDLQVVADQKFDRFAKKTNERFRHLDRRFDAVDGRFNSVDTRLDSVDTRLDSVDTRLDVIGERLGEIVNLLRNGGAGCPSNYPTGLRTPAAAPTTSPRLRRR